VRRYYAMVQIVKYQESQITQADVVDQGNVVGEVEVGVLMAESMQTLSDTRSLSVSQPTGRRGGCHGGEM
jgi:hypothetical protein